MNAKWVGNALSSILIIGTNIEFVGTVFIHINARISPMVHKGEVSD
jgi:hypothetical protein